MQIITLLPVSKFYENLHAQRGCIWPTILKTFWVDKNGDMVNIRTESPIDTNFSAQYGDKSNFDGSEKII